MKKYVLGVLLLAVGSATSASAAPTNPLLNWNTWRGYRGTVVHPALEIKADDIVRARANIAANDWAKKYRDDLVASLDPDIARLTPEWIEQMIPETTPLDGAFTPCPACRDLGKPLNPHGNWQWNPNSMNTIRCGTCNTVFPNDKYPESVVLTTKWNKPQTLTFYGGEPFTIFGRVVRPSFTGNIRARKVEWMRALVRRLGEAYALTGDAKYAVACRSILLRFAAVYPNWLVHSGYGDYADMDPKVSSQTVNALPEDELTYPPNKPDRKLETGYWSAGRSGGVGMDGAFVRRVVEGYDLTCTATDAAGAPVYSDAERKDIEEHLLLESTALLVGDRGPINNKSIGNRTAVALVGICCSVPGLVRFGLNGFDQTMKSWFLPDGTTPESTSYAFMTLDGMIALPQAMKGYSDPPNYADMYNVRYDKLDLYQNPAFANVWRALYAMQQGDLSYPPLADAYAPLPNLPRIVKLGPRFAEIMAANYPDNADFQALLREVNQTSGVDASVAIYSRNPAAPAPKAGALQLPDIAFPDLRQGYMRTGADGRESLMVLNASQWGGHHHLDSLNLYYWKNGQELLSDLGYLWDHPRQNMTVRTLAHNVVMIDEQDQRTKERGGDVEFFTAGDHVKAMRAKSTAYAQTSIYQRTSAIVDHGAAGSYAVDFFRVQGGKTQDYVFHGPAKDFQATGITLSPATTPVYDLTNVQTGTSSTGANFTWKINPQLEFNAWLPPVNGETYFVGAGWGQRDYRNNDAGATLPYIVRRTQGDGAKIFTAVFEGHMPGKPLVKSVRSIEVPGAEGVVALAVETTDGTDVIVSTPGGAATKINTLSGVLETNAPLAVVNVQNKKALWSFTSDKSLASWNNQTLNTKP
jgi:hypothetical protein